MVNFFSCIILFFVVYCAHKQTLVVEEAIADEFSDGIKKERQMNNLVTGLHLILILSFTMAAFLHDNIYTSTNTSSFWRVFATLLFCTALEDIFLAYMMFVIFDS